MSSTYLPKDASRCPQHFVLGRDSKNGQSRSEVIIDILGNRSLIGPACLPLLTVVVMSPTVIKQALVLYAGPVY